MKLSFRDIYWNIRRRLFHKYHIVKTTLNPYHYHEVNTRLLYSSMQILVDYVEVEKGLINVEWDWHESHKAAKNKIIELYHWWKIVRPLKLKEIQDAYDSDPSLNHENFGKREYRETPEYKISIAKLDKIHKLEEDLVKEEIKMLQTLAEIKEYLWT